MTSGGIFDPVTLAWNGRDYTIAADRIMGAIARIEAVITLQELGKAAQSGHAPMAKLAMAYGAALRYAGASARDEEVYAAMFGPEGGSVGAAVSGLLAMMIPPARPGEKPKPGKDQPTAGKSSRKRSSSRSGPNGARPNSFGGSTP